MIKDFMQKQTPWNEIFCYNLKINNDELFQLKTDLLSKMIFSYQYNIIYPMNFSNSNDITFCEPDKIIYKDILAIKNCLEHENIYSEDNLVSAYSDYINSSSFAFIQIIKHYIHVLTSKGYTINKNNYNCFRLDVKNIYEIYNNLQYETGLIYSTETNKEKNSNKSRELYDRFYNKLYKEVNNYINHNFRTSYEKKSFVKYLLSLSYSYLKSLNNLTEEDESIIELIENSEKDEFIENIFRFKDLFCLVLEIVYNLYYDNGEYYDIRKCINDNIDTIYKLDNTYTKNDKEKYKMDSLYTELYLEYALESFELDKMKSSEIFDYLMNHRLSIYDRLYDANLDPRFELEYKKDLIRKIVADNYEYHCYLTNGLNENLDINHYLELNKIDTTKFQNILEYFVNNYSSLIDNYYAYQHESIYFSEKARLDVCRLKSLDKLIQIDRYALSRYLIIFSKIVVELPSVDYMNMCIKGIQSNYKDYDYDEIVKMLNVMCLNIYEKLLIGQIEGSAMPYLKNYIENTENVGEHLLEDEVTRQKLEELFIKINGYEISYSEEVKIRKKIDSSHIKILKKINPFNE